MMIERLSSLVRIIGQIFKVERAFLLTMMSDFAANELFSFRGARTSMLHDGPFHNAHTHLTL